MESPSWDEDVSGPSPDSAGDVEPDSGGITKEPADGGEVPTAGGLAGASRFVEAAVVELPASAVVLAPSDGPGRKVTPNSTNALATTIPPVARAPLGTVRFVPTSTCLPADAGDALRAGMAGSTALGERVKILITEP